MKSNFRDDEQAPSMPRDQSPEGTLAVALTVDVSSIEKGHAGFDRRFESCLDLTHRYRVVD